MKNRVLCFDLGASGGRAMLAEYEGCKINLTEVHRFKNRGISVNGTLYWDILSLYSEIRTGLVNGHKAGGYSSVGIDTWGVDYGIIDKNGFLIGNPVQYRDKRTNGMISEAFRLIKPETLYSLTGNQIMEINTAFQLLAEKRERPYALENGAAMLNIPDLLAFMLTGEISSEMSAASTTQLFDPVIKDWSYEVIGKLGLPEKIFPKLVPPGSSKGMLSGDICNELNIPPAEVIAVCGHDTQCASFAAPAKEDSHIFLSSGTWSLFGTTIGSPILSRRAFTLALTNETGFGGRIDLLKNITGLWLVQETKTFLSSRGTELSYAELEEEAELCRDFTAFIDTDSPEFGSSGDIPGRIRNFCERTGQAVPQSIGEIMRTIYLSLAMKYRLALEQIIELTGRTYGRIYAVGGGTRDKLLCRLTASVCGIPVTAGPVEATVMGSAAIQLLHSGAIGGHAEIPDIIRRSEELREYSPEENFDREYATFKKIL